MQLDRFNDTRACILSAVAVLISVIATVPVLEMGVNDDWSYAFSALRLAQTGRLTYNGWGQPFLGVQALWGAWTIQLFGFSFTGLRLSLLPFAMGCATVLFLLSRRVGLRTGIALFGTLTFCLSPLFIPLASSFMTDIPAVFFTLLSLFAFTAAIQAQSGSRRILWLAAATLAGIAAGTVRQISYLAPLAVLPAVLLGACRVRSKQIILACAVLWLVTLLTWMGTSRWQSRQPYVKSEAPLTNMQKALAHRRATTRTAISIFQATLLFILPVGLVYAGTRLLSWSKRRALAAILLAFCLMWGTRRIIHVPTLIGNTVTWDGFLDSGTEALGRRPAVLPRSVLIAAVGLVYLTLSCVILEATRSVGTWPLRIGKSRSWEDYSGFLILPVFAAAYFAALVFVSATVFDRYILPLLPPFIIVLLLLCQTHAGPRILAAGSIGLFVNALYGVATTHDYLASGRARAAAAGYVEATGVPRTNISAGLEYDSWTELTQAGHLSRSPMGKIRLPPPAAANENYWFWANTPHVQPRYIVVHASQPHLIAAPFPRFPYRTWLPPFRREVMVQMLPAETPGERKDAR